MLFTAQRHAFFFRLIIAATLLLSGCGGGGSAPTTATQSVYCNGCTFIYATTEAGPILEFPLQAGTPTSIAGPANSFGIVEALAPNLPDSRYLYVSDPAASVIRIYSISSVNGALSGAPVDPFPIPNADGTPGEIIAFGTGPATVLYVATSTGTIEALNINADGSLSGLVGSPFTAGKGLSHLVTATVANSIFLYAANTEDSNGSISAFTIEPNGALEPIPGSPFPTVPNGGPAGFYDGGSILYVALKNANAVAAFAIANDGSLTPIAGSPFAAGHGTSSLCSADGFLFATNNIDGTISSYSVNPSTGALTAVTGSPFAGSVTSGDTLYVGGSLFFVPSAQSESINAFEFDSAGAVQALSTPSFRAASGPVALTSVFLPVIDPP
jgi:6-phosphogluconolactonase (cycloisomerase 2 family)